ncbi:MAG: GGDEF domain-containing protein [Moraxellaceae bacterium]|nr:GGDEF domain-containing protein [Moraxellaceae bacterium]
MKLIDDIKKLGNPIDWSEAEKTQFAIGIVLAQCLYYGMLATLLEYVPLVNHAADLGSLHFTRNFAFAAALFWAAVFFVMQRIRQTHPNLRWPGILVIYLLGQPLMVLAVMNGVHALVTGLLLASMPVLGFVLFNNRHVMLTTALIWIEIIVISMLVSMGLLPDSPLFANLEEGSRSPVWLIIQVIIGLPTVIIVLLAVHSLLHGLRSREQKILELSRRDGLTGVWNRRYLNELMTHGFAVAHRSQTPLAVLMVDLDHFKRINDTHGHQAGDLVLQTAAHTLQSSLRDIDHVGRYGGEEFMVLLPFCDADTAMIIAERCRRAIASLQVDWEGRAIPVTASIGVSAMPAQMPVGDITLLSSAADRALYEAKSAGRNRIVFSAAA